MGITLSLLGATAAVMNTAPVGALENGEPPLEAVAGPDVTVEVGEEVAFDATGSTGGESPQYLWFFGDGEAEEGGLPSYGTDPVTSFTYAVEGVYEALLLVVAEDGSSAWDTRVITVQNVLPTPFITVDGESTGGILEVQEDQTVAFGGGASVDTEPLTYRWSFGDGEEAEGVDVEHAYAQEGAYVARLEVEDAQGARNRAPLLVLVDNVAPSAAATFPAEAGEDETVVFDASATTDTPSDLEHLTYIWDLDGTLRVGSVVEHAFGLAGVHPILLAVVDDNGAASVVEGSIEILNGVPTAAAVQVLAADEGATVFFDGSASGDSPSDLPLLQFWWDVDEDGEAEMQGANASYVFPDDSAHPVELTVTDDDGSTSAALQEVEVQNVAPHAGIVDVTRPVTVNLTVAGTPGHQVEIVVLQDEEVMASGSSIRAPGDPKAESVVFEETEFPLGHNYAALVVYVPLEDESGSNPAWLNLSFGDGSRVRLHHTFNVQQEGTHTWELDLDPHLTTVRLVGAVYEPGADDLDLEWDFGDGAITEIDQAATGVPTRALSEVYHTFPLGEYVVEFRATDDDGGIGGDRLPVHAGEDGFTVGNLRPRILPPDPVEVQEDQELPFVADVWDPDGEVTAFHWDFRDGAVAETAEAVHTFPQSGTYHVLLTVMDDEGEATVDSMEVRVSNPAPVPSITAPEAGVENAALEFSAAGTTDNPSDLASLRYYWTFGDGSVAPGLEAIHSYAQAGTYIVTLRVQDDNGAVAETSVEVVVENLPPIAGFAGPDEVLVEDPALFDSTSEDTPTDAAVLDLLWAISDPSGGEGTRLLHTFFEPGVFEVGLTATDDNGEGDATSAEVQVLNRAPVAHLPFSTLHVYAHGGTASMQGLGFDTLFDEPSLAFTWDFGDDTASEGAAATHTYAASGVYEIVFEVVDAHGAADVDSAVIVVILDSDGDGLPDLYELEVTGTDPASPDTDGDGVWDAVELLLLGTDPLLPPEA